MRPLIVILLGIGILLLLLVVQGLRTQRLKERYALLFLFLGLPFLVLAAWPDAVGYVAHNLDIEYPTVLLLCVTTFFLLMNFKLLSLVSVQDQKINTLTQMMGILMNDPNISSAAQSHQPVGRKNLDDV